METTKRLLPPAPQASLPSMRILLETLVERLDDLERAYRGENAEPGALRALIPAEYADGTFDLALYPAPLLDHVLATEAAFQQSLRATITHLERLEHEAAQRYRAAWREWYNGQNVPNTGSRIERQRRHWAAVARRRQHSARDEANAAAEERR